jgi:hypothetical protein
LPVLPGPIVGTQDVLVAGELGLLFVFGCRHREGEALGLRLTPISG